MKNILIILLIAIGFTISCYSIPQFILDHQVTLTPEQKTAYEQKVRERPDEYSFNPMHPNDYWVYEIAPPFPGEPTTYGRFWIAADTLINSQLHFKMMGPGTDGNHWIKNDSDFVCIYDNDNLDNNPLTDYLINENFNLESGIFDTLYWSINHGNPFEIVPVIRYGASGFINLFGEVVEYQGFMYFSSMTCVLMWARKYGIIYSEGEFCSMGIIGAYIDGLVYGTVSNTDNFVHSEEEIVTFCYPNPFRDKLYISVKDKYKSQVNHIEIYNVKGQRILKDLIDNSNVYIWNGTDDKGRPVASGMYFYKLITPDKVLTNKMVLLK